MIARVTVAVGLILTAASQWATAGGYNYKPGKAERGAMLRELDQVFGWAGVKRLSDLQELGCSASKDYAQCTAKISLAVDGISLPYNIEFAGKPRKVTFAGFYPDEPIPFDIELASRGYNADQNTIKDPNVRAFAVAAVRKFNTHLHWQWVSGPSIHREGRNFLVTYHVFSDEERKRVFYIHPTLVTFYVSSRGTISGALFNE